MDSSRITYLKLIVVMLLIAALPCPVNGQLPPAIGNIGSFRSTPRMASAATTNSMVRQASFAQERAAQAFPVGVDLSSAMTNEMFRTAVRIKEITTIEGHRGNTVEGMGLVVGLKNTGGKDETTQQMALNMYNRAGIRLSQVATNNMSAVSVTAEIPPFYKKGEVITATVATLDDASSLAGGELRLTALVGIDGQTYAFASGPVIVGGFSASGAGASVARNHDTAGKVKATIEVEIETGPDLPGPFYRLLLNNKDYATANAISNAVNRLYPGHAQALDPGTVEIYFPQTFVSNKSVFVSQIEQLRVTPDTRAVVLISERTGTILAGRHVKLSKFMFGLDNLIVTTSESPIASQPAPLSAGQTVVLPRTDLTVTQTGGRYNMINEQTTVGDLATALNALGASPREMITIFQAAADSGSLQAQLKFK